MTFLEGDCAKERGWAGSGTGVDSKCVVGCSRLLSVELVAVVAEVCDGKVDSVIEEEERVDVRKWKRLWLHVTLRAKKLGEGEILTGYA